MKSKQLHQIITWLMLLIFIAFRVDATFFSHVHNVDGVIVIHSHFYHGKTDGGEAHHEHSTNELLVIAQLSALHSLNPLSSIIRTYIPSENIEYYINNYQHTHKEELFSYRLLRSPPHFLV